MKHVDYYPIVSLLYQNRTSLCVYYVFEQIWKLFPSGNNVFEFGFWSLWGRVIFQSVSKVLNLPLFFSFIVSFGCGCCTDHLYLCCWTFFPITRKPPKVSTDMCNTWEKWHSNLKLKAHKKIYVTDNIKLECHTAVTEHFLILFRSWNMLWPSDTSRLIIYALLVMGRGSARHRACPWSQAE